MLQRAGVSTACKDQHRNAAVRVVDAWEKHKNGDAPDGVSQTQTARDKTRKAHAELMKNI